MNRFCRGTIAVKNQKKRNKSLSRLKEKGPWAPLFILVRPQMAENIGMVARAMMNCGLYDLRLVQPKATPDDEKALAASSGADPILKGARVFESLEEATADLNSVVATTARPRDVEKDVLTVEEFSDLLPQMKKEGQKVGILFGCERTGLENEELTFADKIITIPLNAEHSSLNLSQAVLLVAYECMKTSLQGSVRKVARVPAPKKELAAFLTRFEKMMDDVDYFRIAEKKPRMLRNLNATFARAGLTSQEIKTWHGVLNSLERKIQK